MVEERLGIGFVGSGFVAHFHARAFSWIRKADIVAICSSNVTTAKSLAELCKALDVGKPRVYNDIRMMLRDPNVQAVWVLTPNYTKGNIVEAIVDEVTNGRARLKGIAIEKPMARNLAEAKRIYHLISEAKIPHGYLENQIYIPALVRGKEILWKRGAAIAGPPYLARCAEEHSGPHRAWFWRGDLQGGGVLNDMLCHSLLTGWHLLTPPGHRMSTLTPKTVYAQIASLKWTRPEYVEDLRKMWKDELEVDFAKHPVEDYASARVVFETAEKRLVIVEATTSWSFVGPGLRLTFEVLGPEYMLQVNTLVGDGQIFFSRRIKGAAGEDMVEKQNAEQGLMPFIADEAFSYGYTAEDRHMVTCFLQGDTPYTTLEEGLWTTALVMAAYKSAEEKKAVKVDMAELENFVPAVAKGEWNPRTLVED